jgi:hypothetical protein
MPFGLNHVPPAGFNTRNTKAQVSKMKLISVTDYSPTHRREFRLSRLKWKNAQKPVPVTQLHYGVKRSVIRRAQRRSSAIEVDQTAL